MKVILQVLPEAGLYILKKDILTLAFSSGVCGDIHGHSHSQLRVLLLGDSAELPGLIHGCEYFAWTWASISAWFTLSVILVGTDCGEWELVGKGSVKRTNACFLSAVHLGWLWAEHLLRCVPYASTLARWLFSSVMRTNAVVVSGWAADFVFFLCSLCSLFLNFYTDVPVSCFYLHVPSNRPLILYHQWQSGCIYQS